MVKVSVIIPTFNRAAFLKQAINSVLKQTYTHYEIIVVDDGSTDDTQQAALSYGAKVRYIYQENAGPSAARNTGIKAAKGKYVAFLDSDDCFLPHKLEDQMNFLSKYPSCRFLYSYYYNVDMNGNILKIRKHMPYTTREQFQFLLLTRRFTIRTSTVLVEKSVFDEVGYFESAYKYSQDWDMWLRIAHKYFGRCLKKPLVSYRLHPTNRSKKSIKIFHPKIYRDTMLLYGWKIQTLHTLQQKYGNESSKKAISLILEALQ